MSRSPLSRSPRFITEDAYYSNNNINDLQEDNDDDDFSSLPFPQPLARSAFTAPDFSASAYLSSLHNRHQTLEDLRSELRSRSKDLEKELLDLINTEYVDFVRLGSSLEGGDGKVKDLMVGVLSFAREVEGVKSKLVDVVGQMDAGLQAKNDITKKKTLARNLLAFANHLSTLEALLLLNTDDNAASTSFLFDSEISTTNNSTSSAPVNVLTATPRLQKLVSSYLLLQQMLSRLPPRHPFVLAQSSRIALCKRTIIEDLSSATRECRINVTNEGEASAKSVRERDERLLKVMGLWEKIGETATALKVLREKGGKSRQNIRMT